MYHRILIVFSLAVIISLRSLANFARENEMNKFFMRYGFNCFATPICLLQLSLVDCHS